eukprot:GFKZ01009131.1.p1 GENE.GFKZ01009131.1~~GFKZ01009131.1.p1  ORF type:complete len:506 (+),score=87.18 GFKZ01009131.1:308-1825(+)
MAYAFTPPASLRSSSALAFPCPSLSPRRRRPLPSHGFPPRASNSQPPTCSSSSSSSSSHSPASASSPRSPKLFIRDTPSAGRGLFVNRTSSIAPHENIVSIPLGDVLIIAMDDDDWPFPKHTSAWVSRHYWTSCEWDIRLCVLLLYHVVGEGTGYQGMLPSEIWTAADLSQTDLDELAYPPLVEAVECYRYRVSREYDRFVAEIGHSKVTRHVWEWALKVVHSRAVVVPPGGFAGGWRRGGGSAVGRRFALVPVVEMMNHGVGEGVVRVRFDEAGGTFELVAGAKGVNGGGQLLVSYGGLNNDELYLWYGFVEAGNRCDVFEVEDVTDWVEGAGEWNLIEAKMRMMERVGLCYEGRKFYVGREEIDPSLVAALRVLVADAEELSRMRSAIKERGQVPKEWFQSIGNANERKVWANIEKHCKRILEEFPTSIELDEEMIILHAASSVPSDPVVANSLLFRVEKKRILKAAAEKAAERRVRLEMEAIDLFESSEFAPPNTDFWADVQ